jgi:putative transposase
MNRIPPSKQVDAQIKTLLNGAFEDQEDLASQLVRLGAQRLVQDALEQEVTDQLGREHYQRRPAALDTAEGRVQIQVPQVRESPEPYRSRLIEFVRGNSDVLQRLAIEMYTRGLSTRDIEETFREVTGESLLSRTAVSQLTEQLWDDYQAFCERDLSGFQVEYLFLDGVYESLRLLALGSKESYPAWCDFLRDMVRRGLNVPVEITTDGAPGLIRAVEEMWPKSLRQRCLAHKVRNILDKVPDYARADVKAAVHNAYYASSRELAERMAAETLEQYQELYPSAMKSFTEDLEACWAYLRCPAAHHKLIRTTNLLERVFVEEKRRTKVIPRFLTEQACLKLVFATLWQTSQRWRGVRMTEFEQRKLLQLREVLHLSPSPDTEEELRHAA